jgi:SHS2 domain-containing protein
MNASGATVEISGESFDSARHSAYREIKAVIAHGMGVERIGGAFVARFIVDV